MSKLFGVCTQRTGGVGMAGRLLLLVPLLLLFTTAVSADPVELLDCPYVDQNCTANDLIVTNVLVTADTGGDDTCDGPGDTVDIIIMQDMAPPGNGDRYDLGVGLDTSGGTGTQCFGEELNSTNCPGCADLQSSEGTTNDCLDIQGNTSVTYSGHYTVPCVDDDVDSILDPVTVFQVWANNNSQNANCVPPPDPTNDPFAGTTAKCSFQVSALPEITVPQPPECGDGNLDSGEQCDNGAANALDASCLPNCQSAACGDGNIWNTDGGSEVCDDGNALNNDSCVNCQPATCGDGFVWNTDGGTEECEPPGEGNCDAECHFIEIVPTTGEWGLVALALLLGGIGAAVLRRKFRLS
jgi:hypothetical protein